MNDTAVRLRRIRLCTWVLIIGLILSGATAIPLELEVNSAARWLGVEQKTPDQATSTVIHWFLKVRAGIQDVNQRYPFMAYGTDWLAFGHFVIAIAFVGALRDPLRNRWLFDFGLIACVAIIPFAMVFGAWRGIPFWWRLIDCSFGIFGAIPVWIARRNVILLERVEVPVAGDPKSEIGEPKEIR